MISPFSLSVCVGGRLGWGGGGGCSKRDTGLNKLNLGLIPGITWIFKNFWKSCLSAAALLSNRSYLPNSLQALEFTVKREIKKKRLSFVPKLFILLVNPILISPQ